MEFFDPVFSSVQYFLPERPRFRQSYSDEILVIRTIPELRRFMIQSGNKVTSFRENDHSLTPSGAVRDFYLRKDPGEGHFVHDATLEKP